MQPQDVTKLKSWSNFGLNYGHMQSIQRDENASINTQTLQCTCLSEHRVQETPTAYRKPLKSTDFTKLQFDRLH